MKNKIGFILSTFGIVFCTFSNVGAGIPVGYSWKNSLLDINTTTPPALMFIQDSSGRKTGGNPSLSVDSVGRQGKILSGLKEIPLSSVEQTNIASDDSLTLGQPQASTSWIVHILDGGSQTYTINLLGLINGVSEITVTAFTTPKKPVTKFKTKIDALVSSGNTTKVNLIVDTSTRTIKTERIVSNSAILNDVNTACQLNLITPTACKYLIRKATHVQNAFQNNKPGEEKSAVNGFLNDLIRLKSSIQPSVFTILQEDANALLQTIVK